MNDHPMITRRKSRIFKPKLSFVEATNSLDTTEPHSVATTLSNDNLRKTIQVEYQALV